MFYLSPLVRKRFLERIAKSNPTTTDVHVNRPLTNMTVASFNEADDFVWDKVFPIIKVDHRSGVYFEYDLKDLYRIQVEPRAPGSPAADGTYRVTNTSYTVDVEALRLPLKGQIIANEDAPLKRDAAKAKFLMNQLAMRYEQKWAADFFATGKWTVDLDGVASGPGANEFIQWDQSGGTPIQDLRTQKAAIKKNCGKFPNTLVLGYEVEQILVDNSEYVDRVKTQLGLSEANARNNFKRNLAALLDIDRVLTTSAIHNSAAEAATASYAFLGGKHALLVYSAPNPSLEEMSGGYSLAWTGLVGDAERGPMSGMSSIGHRIKKYYVDEKDTWYLEGEMAVSPKLVAAGAGAFFESAVA